MIYSIEKNEDSTGFESSKPRIEDNFVNEICEIVIEALNVNHNDRRLIKPLLINSISKKVNCGYYKELGLLQQYEAYILETSIERLKRNFNLTSKINHDYATQAKYSDIITEISKNEKPNEKSIQRIINEVGVPLPKYDYVKRKFIVKLPINIPSKDGGVTGSLDIKEFDSFSEALEHIIYWNAIK